MQQAKQVQVQAQEVQVQEQEQVQTQEVQTQFVPLTGAIISYIVNILDNQAPPSWIMLDRPYRKYDIILNVYKAFECFAGLEEEDALWDYKKNIQHFIANYLFGEVLQQLQVIGCNWWLSKLDDLSTPYSDFSLVWYNSTDREVMYFYDVLFGNPQFILNSNKDNDPLRVNIGKELFDCHYYVSRLQPEYNDYSEVFVTIHDIPVIRLLEEALYNKSTDCINCLMQSGLYNKHMLLYIYIKHNHKVWGANERRSLADSDLLFDYLLKDADLSKSLLLEVAIGGLTIKNTNVNHFYNNVVNPNLALVKKMVPEYFQRDEEILSLLGEIAYNNSINLFEMRPNEFSLNAYAAYLTPYDLWKGYINRQLFAPIFGNGKYDVYVNPRNKEIGEYLLFAKN